MKRTLFALLVAFLLPASPAVAVEDKDQLEALRAQAVRGDVAAQYEMGVLYEFGFRMPDNLPHALAWYMVAAENGDERAVRRRDLLLGQLSAAQSEEARRLKSELGVKPGAMPAKAAPEADKPAAESPAPPAENAPAADKPAADTPAATEKPATP